MSVSSKGFERAGVQPNPGWGDLCDSCAFADMARGDLGCRKVEWAGPNAYGVRGPFLPDLVRFSPSGRDARKGDRLGIDFEETCSDYQRGEKDATIA